MKRTGLIVDSFAGGGGASTGIELALGRSPDLAINHDPEAIALHTANHPETHHACESVWQVRPEDVADVGGVDLLWASPDCKHFSKAKGGKPVDKGVRGLAWVVVAWARKVRPKVIILENVLDVGGVSKTAQVRMIGNSVCPPLAKALVEANVAPKGRMRGAA